MISPKEQRDREFQAFKRKHNFNYKEEVRNSDNYWFGSHKLIFDDGAIWYEDRVQTIENGVSVGNVCIYDDVLTVTYWNTDDTTKKTYEKSRIQFKRRA